MGKYYEERDGNLNDSIACYNDCLQKSPNDIQAMLSIAKIHQNQGNNELCLNFSKKVLKIEASNEEATYILANLMLMKGQTEGAISTYMALLEKEPNNFNILANLIELMKRAGNISEAQKYLDNAE